jgi:hypothetical protein
MFSGFGKRMRRRVHHQRWRLQGRHAIAEITDVLSQKAGAHFSSSSLEKKMIPVTKRSAGR